MIVTVHEVWCLTTYLTQAPVIFMLLVQFQTSHIFSCQLVDWQIWRWLYWVVVLEVAPSDLTEVDQATESTY